MSGTQDLPCTVTNMSRWIQLIREDHTFIKLLNEYQVSQTKRLLIRLVQEVRSELALLKIANPDESFSIPDLEMYLSVLEIINNRHKEKSIEGQNDDSLFNDVPECLRIEKNRFEEIEKWLIAQKYLSPEGVWIKEKQDFAALLQYMIDKDIFGSRRKDSRAFRTGIRKTFESRYQFESIAEQFKPGDIRKELFKQFEPGLSPLINPVTR